MIPHNKPTIDKAEITAVSEVLKSSWVAEGPKVQEFERLFSRVNNFPTENSVAVSSGTAALYVGLKVLGVKEKDEVILPTYTCSAVLNAVFMVGAKPVLVDVEEGDFNPSVTSILEKITKNTKAIIVTHTFGFPFDVLSLASKTKIPVLEDCATALGSKINGKNVGNFGAVAAFSFYASKYITTGYGGMVASLNKKISGYAREFREFDGVKNYEPRFNFQMSDTSAAMGIAQLEKLPKLFKGRKQIADLYDSAITEKIRRQSLSSPHFVPNNYRYVLRFQNARLRDKAEDLFLKRGIKTIVPIENWELLHNYLKLDKKLFPKAELISSTTLSIPIFPSLADNEIEKIAEALKEL